LQPLDDNQVSPAIGHDPPGGIDGRRYAAKLRDMSGLRAQLTRVTSSAEVAADLLHDAIVTALQKLRSGEISDEAYLDGYVYRVALNHYRNLRRKDRGVATGAAETEALVDAHPGSRPAELVEGAEWAHLVSRLLSEVTPARDRELLVRFYLHEEEKDDLCREFGLSERHFNRVIHRARDRFRVLLRQRGFARSDFLSIVAILTGIC
jgi:RNA polymerase sigma-70 factor, ECF subfamily